jgi:heme exporter protein A
LARLLAKKCALWLLDEPFTAVDSAGIDALESIILEHVKDGGMVVLTSHQPIKLRDLSVQTLTL